MQKMTFKSTEEYLNSLQMFGIKLGLDQVTELLESCGSPEKNLKFIHLAGSNGKGSTAAMLESALRNAGLKTGFYSSPHLISVRERFRVDGKSISEKDFAKLISSLYPHIEKMKNEGRCPTYFEVTTVMAAKYFADSNVDFVIWETGMGGRFDATNVVTPTCSIITGIALDHQAYLGDSIEKIAFEKAGIVKDGIPVFCGKLSAPARKVIEEVCDKKSLTPRFAEKENPLISREIDRKAFTQILNFKNETLELSLPGKIQADNASLALTVLKYLSQKYDFEMGKALPWFKKVKWPARMQVLPDGSVLDGAHNPDGALVLKDFLDEFFPDKKFTIIFGSFEDKAAGEVLEILSPKAEEFLFVPLKGNRKSRTGIELEQTLRTFSDIPCRMAESFQEAYNIGNGKQMLITGSLYLAGEALSLYSAEEETLDI